MTLFRIMLNRHSAFYSPLLGTVAGGFLSEEGLDPHYGPTRKIITGNASYRGA
jgi:hypothetical protein